MTISLWDLISKLEKWICFSFCRFVVKREFEIFLALATQYLTNDIDFETSLRTQGLWEEYQTFLYNSDVEGMIQEFEHWINEEIEHNAIQSYITEAGDVEKWTGSVKNKLLESKEEAIKYLQSLKKQ